MEAILFIIALIATVLAFIQNLFMFSLGVKEQAIFSSPLPFVGLFVAEIASIWAGYFCVRKLLRKQPTLALAAWVIVILGAAELLLPVSFFSTWVQHVKRATVLDQIEQVGTSIEPLASNQGGGRFALTYTLTRFIRERSLVQGCVTIGLSWS